LIAPDICYDIIWAYGANFVFGSHTNRGNYKIGFRTTGNPDPCLPIPHGNTLTYNINSKCSIETDTARLSADNDHIKIKVDCTI